MSTYNSGISIFFRTPGAVEQMRCAACGAVCTVRRDTETYTCMASAMAKRKSRVDEFSCPHVGADWHQQAVQLVEAIAETPSRRVAALIRQDLEDLLLRCGVEGVSVPDYLNE